MKVKDFLDVASVNGRNPLIMFVNSQDKELFWGNFRDENFPSSFDDSIVLGIDFSGYIESVIIEIQ